MCSSGRLSNHWMATANFHFPTQLEVLNLSNLLLILSCYIHPYWTTTNINIITQVYIATATIHELCLHHISIYTDRIHLCTQNVIMLELNKCTYCAYWPIKVIIMMRSHNRLRLLIFSLWLPLPLFQLPSPLPSLMHFTSIHAFTHNNYNHFTYICQCTSSYMPHYREANYQW